MFGPLVLDPRGLDDYVARVEAAPTTLVPVLRQVRGRPELAALRWGFPGPHSTFNARVETASTLPTFRSAWRSRRCVVVASAFCEWGPTKVRHRLAHVEGPILLAGLWEGSACTVLTRPAEGVVAALHDRMPVLLHRHAALAWIGPSAPANVLDEARIDLDVQAIERPTAQLGLWG